MEYDKHKEYKNKQKGWIKKNNIKVGDKVKVLRRAENYEGGWGTFWSLSEQDKTIGKVYEIEHVGTYSVALRMRKGMLCYPYFVLELVKQEPKTMTLAQIREFYKNGG
jgi:hypothetical protein